MLGRAGIDQAFINSFIITIPATVLVVMIAAFAAYAFAWMDFPGRNILFVVVVGLLVVPLQITLIPVLNFFRDFQPAGIKINGTMLAVWLAHTGYGLPFAVYLLRNYFGSLPREVFESAAIDGASPSTSFFRLALPMSVPALASLIIFQFLWVWNDLLVALVYLGARPGEPSAVGRAGQPDDLVRWRLAVPDGGGVHLDDRPDHRVPVPAALLRARHHRWCRQGLTRIPLSEPTARPLLLGAGLGRPRRTTASARRGGPAAGRPARPARRPGHARPRPRPAAPWP